MALTKIPLDIIKDSTITPSDLATSGTANSSTVLHGNDSWAAVSSSGALNVAAADPGVGQTSGNTWFLTGLLNFVSDSNSIPGVWVTSGNSLLAKRYAASCGIQTAMLSVGGLGGSGITNTAEKFSSLVAALTLFILRFSHCRT